MEIIDEIKTKVIAQYLGQQMLSGHYLIGVRFGDREERPLLLSEKRNSKILDWEATFEMDTLILRPLSEITDEDAIAVANIFGIKGDLRVSRSATGDKSKTFVEGYHSVQVIREHPSWWSINIPKKWEKNEFGLDIYQFLQSKGYDMPHHLLGGKTLEEAGLAVYEEKK